MKRNRTDVRKELEEEAVLINALNIKIPQLHQQFLANPNDEAIKTELTAAITQFQAKEASMQLLITELENCTE